MKFNTSLRTRAPAPTRNLAGGEAYALDAKTELATLLLTCFLKDQFYRSADASAQRIRELVAALPDKRFAAQAALHARLEAGMRSVSHLVAAEIAHQVKGGEWTARFFDRVIHRVDDVLEVLSCYLTLHGRPIPNALKKGLGRALARSDAYQLAKYRHERASLKLVDAVNLLHPPHTEALRSLVRGTLSAADTWETRLTQAGQSGDDQHRSKKRAAAWRELVGSRRIGYFALLRNLRNILAEAPDLHHEVIALLTDEALIRRSLVLPFRFRTALKAVAEADQLPGRQDLMAALSVAVDLSLANAPRFPGRTLVAVDSSGSMQGQPIEIASLFAAVLYKAARGRDVDLMLFSDSADYAAFDAADATLTLADRIQGRARFAGTNFHAILERASRPYDRIIILSDMQGWMGRHAPVKPFEAYCARHACRPKIFSFDLAGHGTVQFPQRDVFCLAGFSDQSLGTLRLLDEDKQALIHRIEQIDL